MNLRVLTKALFLPELSVMTILSICCFFVAGHPIDPLQISSCADKLTISDNKYVTSQSEKSSDGVTPSHAPTRQFTAWSVAIEVGNDGSKNLGQKSQRTLNYALLLSDCNHFKVISSIGTISLVDSDLGNQFTLVGEKPSGTS